MSDFSMTYTDAADILHRHGRDALEAAIAYWGAYCVTYELFTKAYLGTADSEASFIDDCGDLDIPFSQIPEELRRYFDVERYAYDAFLSDYVMVDGHVFSRHD